MGNIYIYFVSACIIYIQVICEVSMPYVVYCLCENEARVGVFYFYGRKHF